MDKSIFIACRQGSPVHPVAIDETHDVEQSGRSFRKELVEAARFLDTMIQSMTMKNEKTYYRVCTNSQMRVFGCACAFLMRVLRSRSVVQKLTLETRINKTRMRVFSLKTENSHDVGSTEFLRGSFSGNSHTQISHIT